MKKLVSLIMVLSLLASCMVGASAATIADQLTDTIEMNIGTCWSTDDSAPNFALNYFKKRVEQLSDGKIQVTLHKGTLGAERELFEAIQLGTLESCAATTGPLGSFVHLSEIFMIPYIFADFNHAFAATDGPLGDEINRQMIDQGMRILGWWRIGSREIYGTGELIQTPEDLAGRKIRVMETDFLTKLYKHYGAVATPMAYSEVYTALQQGVIDGCQAGLPSYSVAHQEVSDFIALLRENLTVTPFCVSEDWWQGLPEAARQIISQAQLETCVIERKVDEAMDAELQKKWADAGCTVYEPDRDAFVAKAREIYDEYKEAMGDEAYWVDWIVAVGEEFPISVEGYELDYDI